MSDTDTLLAQALALVNEDRRGQLADVIEAIVEQRVTAANDFWLTRIYDWDPTPATDAIFYAIYGRATRTQEEAHQVYELVQDARRRAGLPLGEDAAAVYDAVKMFVHQQLGIEPPLPIEATELY